MESEESRLRFTTPAWVPKGRRAEFRALVEPLMYAACQTVRQHMEREEERPDWLVLIEMLVELAERWEHSRLFRLFSLVLGLAGHQGVGAGRPADWSWLGQLIRLAFALA